MEKRRFGGYCPCYDYRELYPFQFSSTDYNMFFGVENSNCFDRVFV